jgi:membrane complex biogenesis BtpA family protein
MNTPLDFKSARLIAMIHTGALPGTPRASQGLAELVDTAVAEAIELRKAGFDAVAVENMHDRPYLNREAGPEIVAAMTVIAREVRAAFGGPCGVQVLAGANEAALAVALAAGCEFIRAEAFVFGHVADEGWMDACAGPLLRYRKQIGAEHVKIVCDIKKKHSAHAVTADVSLAETAKAAEFFLADGVIVTGEATGCAADLAEVRAAKGATSLPVLVGSGVTPENVRETLAAADAVIVGSWIKAGGHWTGALDPERARRFVEAAKG